jgi:hypothetical protein
MRRRGGVTVVLGAVALAGCVGLPAEEEAAVGERRAAFTQGAGPFRGHEDITRFGIDLANPLIETETGVAGFFPTVVSGDSCDVTTHAILLGGCATDFPDSRMSARYGVDASDWGLAPTLQDLHFLRNWVGDDGVVTARATCLAARSRIQTATEWAVAAWQADETEEARYWIGHALHTIQDSFAPPHTRRSGTLLRRLDDVCSYVREVDGVCFHPELDLGDRVWRETVSCALDPDERSWDCLKPQAQAAARATAGYLRVVARYLDAGATGDLGALLATYFAGGALDDFVDYFHCETLGGEVNGTVCATAAACESGYCVDGVCCDSACDGLCETCVQPGLTGTCAPAAAQTDPRSQCEVASGGHPSCAGLCDGARHCVWPGATAACELCGVCDGAGHCTVAMTDDAACGVIDCHALDTPCRSYAALTSERCAGVGACKEPNVAASCTSWVDLCPGDAGAAGDAPAPGADGAAPAASGGGCAAGGRPPATGPALAALGALLAARRRGRRRARRRR